MIFKSHTKNKISIILRLTALIVLSIFLFVINIKPANACTKQFTYVCGKYVIADGPDGPSYVCEYFSTIHARTCAPKVGECVAQVPSGGNCTCPKIINDNCPQDPAGGGDEGGGGGVECHVTNERFKNGKYAYSCAGSCGGGYECKKYKKAGVSGCRCERIKENPPATPQCTIQLDPDESFISSGVEQTLTATTTSSNGTIGYVTFESLNTGIATVDPSSDSSVVYSTGVTGLSEGSTVIVASGYMSGVPVCVDTSTVNVTSSKPWWQAKDMDIMAAIGNIFSAIPLSCVGSCSPTLILDGTGGFPGVAVYGGELGIGSGDLSSTEWDANTNVSLNQSYTYDYFESQIPSDVTINEITTSEIQGSYFTSNGTETDGYYWFHFDGETLGDLTIQSEANIGNRKVVLLVNGGNLNIDARITVTNGFFGAFVGENSSNDKGDIIIDETVTHPVQPSLEGVFFADGEFMTGTGGAENDDWLYIRGSVAAMGGINLERDLSDNSDQPAEYFEFAPEFMLLFPKELRARTFRWEEVAP